MNKERELAEKIIKNIGVDPSDCRIVQIFAETLCSTPVAIDIITRGLELYIATPEERIDRLTKGDKIYNE